MLNPSPERFDQLALVVPVFLPCLHNSIVQRGSVNLVSDKNRRNLGPVDLVTHKNRVDFLLGLRPLPTFTELQSAIIVAFKYLGQILGMLVLFDEGVVDHFLFGEGFLVATLELTFALPNHTVSIDLALLGYSLHLLDGPILRVVLALAVALLLLHEGVALADGQVQGVVIRISVE